MTAPLRLSRVERAILANQMTIMELLDPGNGPSFSRNRHILQNGFVNEYSSMMVSIAEEELSLDECREVINIMQMHGDLAFSYRWLIDKSGLDQRAIEFVGFDANSEAQQHAYCKFLVERGSTFDGLMMRDVDLNSHAPTLRMYRDMLTIWHAYTNSPLTKEQIVSIVEAKHPPFSY